MTQTRQLLRHILMNDTAGITVRSLVGDRIYPAEIVSVGIPAYPCINFAATGGTQHPIIRDVYQPTFRLWTWSLVHYDQAHQIHDAVAQAWHSQAYTNAIYKRAVSFRQAGPPDETFDPDAEAYGVVSTWHVAATRLP